MLKKNSIPLLAIILLLGISVSVLCGAALNGESAPPKRAFVIVAGFEERYIHNAKEASSFELVETIDYDLSKANPTQIYSIENNGDDLVFSFANTQAPVNFFVSYGSDADIDSQPQGGTNGGAGVYVEAKADETVNFGYTLGYKLHPDPQVKSKEPADFSRGEINVYRVKRGYRV